ncbi:MAG: hypothetical protein LBU84_10150 [Prevotella sp.]|jgi:tetratricopeptide (TPR) repeat protein|nr:hypothetical protein [Prevotella sp.]
MGTSVAQEFYKVQDCWKEIDQNKKWKLAIWSVGFQDVDIIDKFIGVETSPLGKFEDIFFHFETEYKGDNDVFEEALYKEYVSWFAPNGKPDEILSALRNDGLLISEYQPSKRLKGTVENLWKEMVRFKSCIKDSDKFHFCAYFQPPRTDGEDLTDWFKGTLKQDIPDGIRLVTIDYAEQRKVNIRASSKVVILKPQLNMIEALNNEIEKGSYISDTVGADGRYRQQVRTVINCSQSANTTQMDKEVGKLLDISKEMTDITTIVGTYMIAAQAYFYIRNNEKSDKYADKTITECEKEMKADPASNLYPIWRGAVMLKAANLLGRKERQKAISLYEKMSEEAINRADTFFIMEGYRLIGYIYYELNQLTKAFENTLLAVAAGAYLSEDIIRQSTFVQAANLALLLAEKIRSPEDVKVIEEQFEDWFGKDWESLIKNDNTSKSKIRRKASIFSK